MASLVWASLPGPPVRARRMLNARVWQWLCSNCRSSWWKTSRVCWRQAVSPDWATFFTSCGSKSHGCLLRRTLFLLPVPFPALAALRRAWPCLHKPGVGKAVYFAHWKAFHALKPEPFKPLKVCLPPFTVSPPKRTGMWGVKKHSAVEVPSAECPGGVGTPFPEP